MSVIQLQTNPICPKCKKNHEMKVVAFDVVNQEIHYQTDCRVRPLVFSVSEMKTQNPELESFYLNSEGWMTYISTHGNYAYQLTTDVAENAYALMRAYEGENGIIHTPPMIEEDVEFTIE